MTRSIGNPGGPGVRPVALLALLLFVAGCASAGSATMLSTVGGPVDAGSGGGAKAPQPGAAGSDITSSGTGAQVLDAARPDLLVIKTGTLDLQVKAIGDAVDTAATRITALGGYVSGSEQTGDGDNVTAVVTYRIPAPRWTEALAALRALAVKVVDEKTQTEEVTGQVVDLTARIANLRATEAALQSIMTQATKISDVLAVQAELTTVRGEIEQATAEKGHLQDQAAMSTLTVGFGLQPEAAVTATQRKFEPKAEVDRASATLVEILQGLVTAGIWFGIVWLPILLVLGVIVLVVVIVARRRLPRPAGALTWAGEVPSPPATEAGASTEDSATPPNGG